MTVHIAWSSTTSGVLVSDSQASTDISKSGGMQKQLVGLDFVLGSAGAVSISAALMDHLCSLPRAVDSKTLCAEVADFLRGNVVPMQHASVAFIALLSQPEVSVKTYRPSTFLGFRAEGQLATLGSGAEFVHNAAMCGASKWLLGPTDSLVHQLLQSIYFADAANESLTVNNDIMASFVTDSKAYVLADENIVPVHVIRVILDEWTEVTNRSTVIFDMVRTCISEVQVATSVFSAIWSGSLSAAHFDAIIQRNAEVSRQINRLETELANYRAWYDGIIGR